MLGTRPTPIRTWHSSSLTVHGGHGLARSRAASSVPDATCDSCSASALNASTAGPVATFAPYRRGPGDAPARVGCGLPGEGFLEPQVGPARVERGRRLVAVPGVQPPGLGQVAAGIQPDPDQPPVAGRVLD